MKSNIPFKFRKQLDQGLLITKIGYCLEATSCTTKQGLKIGKKLMNRLVREVCGEWRWEETQRCYEETGWLKLGRTDHSYVIVFRRVVHDIVSVVYHSHKYTDVRTYLLAQKLLQFEGSTKLLKRFASKEDGIWHVKEEDKNIRTRIYRRCFSNRVRRIWNILPADFETHNLKSKSEKKKVSSFAKALPKEVTEWILWGNETEEVHRYKE